MSVIFVVLCVRLHSYCKLISFGTVFVFACTSDMCIKLLLTYLLITAATSATPYTHYSWLYLFVTEYEISYVYPFMCTKFTAIHMSSVAKEVTFCPRRCVLIGLLKNCRCTFVIFLGMVGLCTGEIDRLWGGLNPDPVIFLHKRALSTLAFAATRHHHSFERKWTLWFLIVTFAAENVLCRSASVTLSRCNAVCVCRISLGGEGNAPYPVLSGFILSCFKFSPISLGKLCKW